MRDCGLRGFPDADVWEYARANAYTLISKDSDFQQRSVLYGSPPKLIWLRIGNCTRQQIVDLVTAHQHDILALETNPLETVLVLS